MPIRQITLSIACATLMATAVSAQADYPDRDIRVIVPWAAGGGTDAIVRKLSSIAEESLPVSMYVENIEGGMSATGLLQLTKARPDGYTIGALTYDSVITVPWQGTIPGFGTDQMKLIARVTSEPDAIITSDGAPWKSFDDLIAAAKEKPNTIRVGIQNMGARTHLTLLQLQDLTGAQFKIVSYPGGAAPQKEALLNGEVDFVITSLGDFAPLIESGKARGLVEFSDKQNEAFPDVPPVSETDTDIDLQMGSFIILAAPARTPDATIETLETAYHDAFESDEFQQWLPKIGVAPDWLGSGDVDAWVKQTQETLFGTMDELAEQGILSK
ncbi:Bug family tripartite tricarboxylate transporter substrate binding protein [Salinicola acroporae]|uniref:Tripartite tricarboxylate transporter substrate binding protein n=1 Tax=Salinicola acroporae TaxID=1541440 RepID=A0ABT6I8X1_9GAMM|nr:tripartite tricarboxylate transporter substrate binding protein [Salinicola acroporae]MDH4573973.1 tripartite tricarboxylate transporter substrate binding protein [Salinicola acroporae]